MHIAYKIALGVVGAGVVGYVGYSVFNRIRYAPSNDPLSVKLRELDLLEQQEIAAEIARTGSNVGLNVVSYTPESRARSEKWDQLRNNVFRSATREEKDLYYYETGRRGHRR